MKHNLSHEVPDYSGETAPATPQGKPKMKKAFPSIVVHNKPGLTKGMKVGKKYKANVIISPTLIRHQEGQERHGLSYPGAENEKHHAEFDVHSIEPMGCEEPDADDSSKDEKPDFSKLGKSEE